MSSTKQILAVHLTSSLFKKSVQLSLQQCRHDSVFKQIIKLEAPLIVQYDNINISNLPFPPSPPFAVVGPLFPLQPDTTIFIPVSPVFLRYKLMVPALPPSPVRNFTHHY